MSAKLTTVTRRPEEEPAELDAKRAEGLARVGRLIGRLQASGYYGKVTVSMQNGKVTEVRCEQVLGVNDF